MKKNDRLRTGDSALVRQINLSVIVNHLRKKAPISRAGLAQATGLNKTTVSSLVDELLQRQLVREIGATTEKKRDIRQSCWISIPRPGLSSVVRSAWTSSWWSARISPRRYIWRHEEHTDPSLGQRGDSRSGAGTFKRCHSERLSGICTLLGIGVGVAALIDQSTGTMLFAPNLKWTEPFPIRAMLQEWFPQAPCDRG